MDIRKIRNLIELLKETGIAEIEIKEGEESLRLSRYSNAPMEPSQIRYSPAPQQVMHHVETGAAQPVSAIATEKTAPASAGHQVRSPMVGTIYTSPSPEAPPYVSIGQVVKTGDTLCIVEAMKMFNEIESDRAGKIVDILISNGEPVEYEQPLFIIE